MTQAIRTYRVTPTLWMGEAPMCGATAVDNVQIAVSLISIGERVVLPHDHWDTARAILQALGMDEATIEDRLRFAKTASYA